MFVDQDLGIIAALTNAEVDVRDLQQRIHREEGVIFTVCPVGGYNKHGQVERVIRSIQRGFDDCGLRDERLHVS